MTTQLDNLDPIRRVAGALLRNADVGERLPTPVDEIVATSGLVETGDYELSESKLSQVPQELRKLLRGAFRKIRGALDRRERVLHVSSEIQVPAQREFVRCHEVMHDALPWQRELLVLADTSETLAPDIELLFEREANQGAAELLFQLDLLARVARDYPTDITTPIALAQLFGASIHATFRRWIENHEQAVCGLVLGTEPISSTPLTLRRYELVESGEWKRRFGARRFPSRIDSSSHPFLSPLRAPILGQVDTTWTMEDINSDVNLVKIQSFCNTYRTFLLVWPPARESLIARHRRRPRIEAY